MLLEAQPGDRALDRAAFRTIADEQRFGRHAPGAQLPYGLEQVAMRLLGPQDGAEADHVVFAGKPQRAAERKPFALAPAISVVVRVDAVVDDLVRRGTYALAP